MMSSPIHIKVIIHSKGVFIINMSVESIHCYCYEYRRKRAGQNCGRLLPANNLLRQTVITVIFTVPINFIHIQTDVSLKTHFSIMYAENSTTAYRNHNNAKSCIGISTMLCRYPAETKDSTLCWMYSMKFLSKNVDIKNLLERRRGDCYQSGRVKEIV